MLMALVALALVLSLAAALAPIAGAQDSGAAPSDTSNWARYRIPTAEQLDLVTSVNPPPPEGMPRDCCITTRHDYPNGGIIIINLSAAQLYYMESPRWYCTESNNHYYP